MREIKFRGKAIDREENAIYRTTYKNGDWVYGLVIYIGKYGSIMTNEIGIEDIKVDTDTISQFTGLYDTNGKEIYEGDILRTERGRLCIVEWFSSDTHQGWDLKPICTKENLKYEAPRRQFLWKTPYIKVVGNIYDNTELLEE